MAESHWRRASLRVRTTAAAVAVVAVALVLGALALVAMVGSSLRDGVEATAEQRAESLVGDIEAGAMPRSGVSEDPDEEPEDLVWQVLAGDGSVVAASQPLDPIVTDEDELDLPGGDAPYVVVTEDADDHTIVVAASLEEVQDSRSALVLPLMVGLPLLLLLVGGTTWMVAARSLAPVERIRDEVEQISGSRLDRRVPVPPTHDEIHRLAVTMNQMLQRLQESRDRQQQFVSDASHELRSPLASIRQTAEVSHVHPNALGEGELAEAVLEEGARMQRLIEQLLLLTRADEGQAVRRRLDVDLDDLALSAARRLHRPDLRVDTSGVGPGRVHGDEVALGQVVQNLLDNAARHASATIAISVTTIGETIVLTVEDDGPGVPPDQRERVFDRFVRLDEARARDAGGSGLGLAIVKQVVQAHDGTVSVASSALGGARFEVRIPS